MLGLELRERADLINPGLLLGNLRFDRLLVDVQALALDVVPGCELVGFALGVFVRKAGDHSEIVERLVSLRLALRLAVICGHGRRSSLLVHQIALQLHVLALKRSFRGFQLQPGVECGLLDLRVAHLEQNCVGLHFRTWKHTNAHNCGLCLRGYLTDELLAGNQRAQTAHLAEHGAALHGICPDGAALYCWSSRFEP